MQFGEITMAEPTTVPLTVTCPCCGKPTSRIKSYEVPVVVFLFLYVVWSYERITGCPPCVRSLLLKRFLISVPLANFAILVVGPVLCFWFIATYDTDRPAIPTEFHHLANAPPPRAPDDAWMGDAKARRRRLIVILVIFAFLAIAIAATYIWG